MEMQEMHTPQWIVNLWTSFKVTCFFVGAYVIGQWAVLEYARVGGYALLDSGAAAHYQAMLAYEESMRDLTPEEFDEMRSGKDRDNRKGGRVTKP